MLANLHRTTLAASLTLLFTGFTTAALAANPQAVTDVGVAATSQAVNVTLVLKLHNQAALAQYIQDTVTPGSPHYQQFLSTSSSPASMARQMQKLPRHRHSCRSMA